MTARSRFGSLALSAGLLAAGVTAVGLAAPADAAIGPCSTAGTGGSAGFYPGPSASDVYDDTFRKGAAIPGLPTYTPQGITTWSNWDGKGNPLLVLGSYRRGYTSRLYGIDPSSVPCRPAAEDQEALRAELSAAANRTYGPTTAAAAAADRAWSGWFS